jgi:hypothetical protein
MARCVTFKAGYPAERKRAEEKLTIGRVYGIRTMTVGQSHSHLEFYDIPGIWNTVFFEAADDEDDDI